jgi:sulfoxide reductase heme-binding subunit YedZ
LVGHVFLGALQTNQSPWLAGLVLAGLVWLLAIHLISGWREWVIDGRPLQPDSTGWVDLGPIDAIPDGRAKVFALAGERVAVFRQGSELFALSNVCQHQNGPLGEGRVVNGCVVCPWHGYEYRLETGASPPPFTECVPTFPVECRQGRVRIGLPPRPPQQA